MIKPTINERFDLLREAFQFFLFLDDTSKTIEKMCKSKAAALSMVLELKEKYEEEFQVEEWTEKLIDDFLEFSIHKDMVEEMTSRMSDEEASFYKWWFGLAIGLLHWDEEAIGGLKELEKQYDDILEEKKNNKTLADLLS